MQNRRPNTTAIQTFLLFSLLFFALQNGRAEHADRESGTRVTLRPLVWTPSSALKEAASSFWKADPEAIKLWKEIRGADDRSRYDFTSPKTQSLQDVLYLLSMTRSGRDLIEKLLPQIAAGHLKFSAIDDRVRQQERVHGIGGVRGDTIYVDWNRPLVEVFTVVSHELGHFLDRSVSPEGKESAEKLDALQRSIVRQHRDLERSVALAAKSKLARDNVADQLKALQSTQREFLYIKSLDLVRSEEVAYRTQDKIQLEFADLVPGYREQVLAFYRREKIGSFPITREDFRRLLSDRVSPAVVDDYFRSLPEN